MNVKGPEPEHRGLRALRWKPLLKIKGEQEKKGIYCAHIFTEYEHLAGFLQEKPAVMSCTSQYIVLKSQHWSKLVQKFLFSAKCVLTCTNLAPLQVSSPSSVFHQGTITPTTTTKSSYMMQDCPISFPEPYYNIQFFIQHEHTLASALPLSPLKCTPLQTIWCKSAPSSASKQNKKNALYKNIKINN